jgi:hypothetical protein
MLSNPIKRNKIVLTDYNFQRDINNRLLLAKLSGFEVEVLEEIIHGSLSIDTQDLAATLGVSKEKLIGALDKLKVSRLFTFDNTITVNKEIRKYYEAQIEKFEDDFSPNIPYILRLLRKVPIQHLPSWYAIPRSSDNIIDSLIDKYLLTPKTYQEYLDEIVYTNPVLENIVKDVFNDPNYEIDALDIREKYCLTDVEFEEFMLHLEFNLVCFLSYRQDGDKWKEVVTPFHEWREYLLFRRDEKPKSILDEQSIDRLDISDFGFIELMSKALTLLLEKQFKQEQIIEMLKLSGTDLADAVVDKLFTLNLIREENGLLHLQESAEAWLDLSIHDKSISMYRHPMSWSNRDDIPLHLCTDRNFRTVEKSLKRVVNSGWIYFDDFLLTITAKIGTREGVTLRKVKKSDWKYVIPEYNKDEKAFIHMAICERLLQVGMISIGTHEGRDCFCLTTFGRISLGD